MILDRLDMFTGSDGPPISFTDGFATVNGGTSGRIIDIGVGLQTTANPSGLAIPGVAAGAGARDLGVGDDPMLKVFVLVSTTFLTGTSLQVSVQGAPDNGSGAPGAFVTMASGPVVVAANLTAGNPASGTQGQRIAEIDVPRPAPGQPLPRYLQLLYTTVGSAWTAGALEAGIVIDRYDQIVGATGQMSGYVPGITIPN